MGSSGSGKSTLARQVSARTGIPLIELDALHHQADWTELDVAQFRSRVGALVADDAWVCDGNYQDRLDSAVQAAADTIVWFDLSRSQVMRQLVARTVRRAVRREELWNGNRERPSTLLRWDPNHNLLRWAWVHHERYRTTFEQLAANGTWAHATVVRLTSHTDAQAWLDTLPED